MAQRRRHLPVRVEDGDRGSREAEAVPAVRELEPRRSQHRVHPAARPAPTRVLGREGRHRGRLLRRAREPSKRRAPDERRGSGTDIVRPGAPGTTPPGRRSARSTTSCPTRGSARWSAADRSRSCASARATAVRDRQLRSVQQGLRDLARHRRRQERRPQDRLADLQAELQPAHRPVPRRPERSRSRSTRCACARARSRSTRSATELRRCGQGRGRRRRGLREPARRSSATACLTPRGRSRR